MAPAKDPHLAAAMRAWDDVQKVYLLDEGSYAPARPTILFVHGSGIGPFPVFNALFQDLSRDYNIAFFLYDHLNPIADIASRLNRSWTAFRREHRPTEPLRIVSLSYGTSVFRYAVLMDKGDLWPGSVLVEIAPVVLGSKYLQWLNAAPGEMLFLQLAVPNLRHWADGVDGKKPPQRIIWAPQGIAGLDKVIRARLSLIPEKDGHLSAQARRQLNHLLGEGKFFVIKGAKHDPAPGLKEVVSQTRRFLESSRTHSVASPTASSRQPYQGRALSPKAPAQTDKPLCTKRRRQPPAEPKDNLPSTARVEKITPATFAQVQNPQE